MTANSTSTRERGALVTVLDPERLLEAGRKAYVETFRGADPKLLHNGPLPQMLLLVDDGTPAVVNGEGVGEVARAGYIGVTFSNGFSWFPLALRVEALGGLATEERVDLAEGIRTFGSRLDGNHHLWRERYLSAWGSDRD